MTLKKLTPRSNELNFRQGFNFGIGIWAAFFVFFSIILPAILCLLAVILALFGHTIRL